MDIFEDNSLTNFISLKINTLDGKKKEKRIECKKRMQKKRQQMHSNFDSSKMKCPAAVTVKNWCVFF